MISIVCTEAMPWSFTRMARWPGPRHPRSGDSRQRAWDHASFLRMIVDYPDYSSRILRSSRMDRWKDENDSLLCLRTQTTAPPWEMPARHRRSAITPTNDEWMTCWTSLGHLNEPCNETASCQRSPSALRHRIGDLTITHPNTLPTADRTPNLAEKQAIVETMATNRF